MCVQGPAGLNKKVVQIHLRLLINTFDLNLSSGNVGFPDVFRGNRNGTLG